MEQQPIMNDHNKEEYPPMHTVEHILNRTMMNLFGCDRSHNAHIERKKSKCDYVLPSDLTEEQILEIESKVNEIISLNLSVSISFVSKSAIPSDVSVSNLSVKVSDIIRIVRVGDYDACACIGAHVGNTSEIGQFHIISHDFKDGKVRLRFKLV